MAKKKMVVRAKKLKAKKPTEKLTILAECCDRVEKVAKDLRSMATRFYRLEQDRDDLVETVDALKKRVVALEAAGGTVAAPDGADPDVHIDPDQPGSDEV